MRCTDCSRDVLPIVVFDIDGTIANYHQQISRFTRDYFGRWDPPMPQTNTYWDGQGEFEEYLGLTKEQYREMKLAFRQGGQKRMMPPIEEGVKLYRHVRNYVDVTPLGSAIPEFVRGEGQDVELWFVTHRPWMRLDNVDPDTRWWLNRYSFKFEHLLFGEDKYGDLVSQVDTERVIAVFEDLPEMCDRAEELGLPVRQVARSHNSHISQKRWHRGTLVQLAYWYDNQVDTWQKDRSNNGD